MRSGARHEVGRVAKRRWESTVAEEQSGGGGIGVFVDETRNEIRKVVWPTREEAWNLTLVVLFVVFLVMAIIFGIDFVFSQVFKFLFQFFGRG